MGIRDACTKRRGAAAISLLFGVVCGSPACSSPTTPSALPFLSGTYLVQIRGDEPACPGIAAAGIDFATTTLTIRAVSGAWRGLPESSAGGAFELEFAPGPVGPGAPGGGPGVTATATGTVISTVPFFGSVADSRVVFGTGVTFSGGLSMDGRVGGGGVSGVVTFANSAGVSVNCSSSSGTLTWFLSWQHN